MLIRVLMRYPLLTDQVFDLFELCSREDKPKTCQIQIQAAALMPQDFRMFYQTEFRAVLLCLVGFFLEEHSHSFLKRINECRGLKTRLIGIKQHSSS